MTDAIDTNELRHIANVVPLARNHIKVVVDAADELDRLKGELDRKEALCFNLLDSLKGCNANNEDFAKHFHVQEAEIAALKAKVERVAGLVDKQCCPDCADNLSAALAGEGE